jgi:hypothetical protein
MVISLGAMEEEQTAGFLKVSEKAQTIDPKARSRRPECYLYTWDGDNLQHQSSPGKQRGCSHSRYFKE